MGCDPSLSSLGLSLMAMGRRSCGPSAFHTLVDTCGAQSSVSHDGDFPAPFLLLKVRCGVISTLCTQCFKYLSVTKPGSIQQTCSQATYQPDSRTQQLVAPGLWPYFLLTCTFVFFFIFLPRPMITSSISRREDTHRLSSSTPKHDI